MENISMPEVRELLKSIETIAIRPGDVTQRDLLIATALFKKLMFVRTDGLIDMEFMIDGKPLNIEVTE